MQVTIEIPEIVAHRAEAAGLDVPTYLQRLIEKETMPGTEGGTRFVRFGPGPLTPAEAGADILELRKNLTLCGIQDQGPDRGRPPLLMAFVLGASAALA